MFALLDQIQERLPSFWAVMMSLLKLVESDDSKSVRTSDDMRSWCLRVCSAEPRQMRARSLAASACTCGSNFMCWAWRCCFGFPQNRSSRCGTVTCRIYTNTTQINSTRAGSMAANRPSTMKRCRGDIRNRIPHWSPTSWIEGASGLHELATVYSSKLSNTTFRT